MWKQILWDKRQVVAPTTGSITEPTERGCALQATLNDGPESCTRSDPDYILSPDFPDPVSS